MKLIPIKLSELNENEKYHVYDDNAHTYFSSHFNAERKVFITEVANSPYAEEFRPREIKAIGAEIITNKELCNIRTGSISNIVEE
jgi:hypothetical protein